MRNRNVSMKVSEEVEDLIDEICTKAEMVREKIPITSDYDLFCLMDTLKMYWNYIEKAQNCKSVKGVHNLRKKMDLV